MRRLKHLALWCLAASAVQAQVPAARPGEGFEVERYQVRLQPDLATTQLVGSETIVLRVTSEQLTQLAFSANALQLSAVTLDAAPVAVSSSKEAIVFTLPRPLRQGAKATLRFALQGKPARGVTALTTGLYTSYFACDWMVCLQESPGDKADLTLDLLLPPGVQSLGVGRRVAVTVGPEGLMWHRWQSTRAYSPYLYAFAAGHFVHRRLPAAADELLAVDATGTGADLARLFESSAGMAAFFADKAGLPLPDGRYTQLLVPGREAQESASFSLIGVDELQREQDDPASAWVTAHEMAHQWWGNQVTCASWRDFWLNEGITTFMVAAWQQHHLGEAAYVQALDVARRRLAEARDAGFDQPLTWGGPYSSLRLRRAVQYSKGALFMAELRQTLGETAFWRGLRAYTRLHAGGRVTSRDFQLAMQKASGRDLSPLFAAWVYEAPPP